MLVLAGRIVEKRGEGRLLFLGNSRRRVLAFALAPVIPLLLKPMQGGNVVLAQERNVQGFRQGKEFVVVGNDAQRFAQIFHVETRRPMLKGVLNPEEPHSLAVVRRIITKLIEGGSCPQLEVALSQGHAHEA